MDYGSSTSEESPHAWTSERHESDEETEEDVELGVYATKQPDLDGMKFMSKGDFRHVKAAVKNIQECMIEEKKFRKLRPIDIERPLKMDGGPRRPGPWRFLEIFTWTCVISMVAHRRACWETFEPITLPGWSLEVSAVRDRARQYLKEVDPDFIMLAPPCGPWSQIQLINQRTPLQIETCSASDLQRARC